MVKKDNSAGRLYEIFKEAKSKPDNLMVKLMWADVFGIPYEQEQGKVIVDMPAVHHAIIALHALVEQTKQELESIPELNRDLYFVPFPHLERTLQANLETSWSSYKHELDDSTMTCLAFCSEKLSQHFSENAIAIEELSSLQKEVEELIETVISSSSIDAKLKEVLIEQLNLIRQAILDYRIRGVSSLRKALEANIGAVIVNREEFQKAKNTEEVSRFSKIVSKMDRLVSVVLAIGKIADAVQKYLPLP